MHPYRDAMALACSLVVLAAEVTPADAQSGISDRVWQRTNSVLSTFRDPKAKAALLWRFKRPVSFNVLDASSIGALEEFIRTVVVPTAIDEACVGRMLERLSAENQTPTNTLDTTAITQVESAFIKERSLSKGDLETYKSYREKQAAELKRLAALPAEQSQAESYKIKQIEAEWETLGRRSDFLDLETRLAKISKPVSGSSDVPSLRTEIYDENKKLNFRLSVPVSQWNQYDAWVHDKKVGSDRTPVPKLKDVDIPAGLSFNAGSCAADAAACSGEFKDPFSKNTAIAVSILAPQFDLPWLPKLLKATANLSGPAESCIKGLRLDRLVLVQGVATLPDFGRLAPIVQLLGSQRSFGEDGLQFAGIPDIGPAYFATPSFADGMLISPHTYLLGFTTYEIDPPVK